MSKKKVPTVLIVDDSDVDGKILEKCLEKEFEVLLSASGEEALAVLSENAIDVVILDIQLPGISGFDVLKSLRNTDRAEYLGIVVLTASDDKGSIERALDLGADGFGFKVDAIHQVLALVRNAMRIKTMTDQLKKVNTKLKKANKRLEKKSMTDHLTGLFNMRQINKIMEQEYKRSLRYLSHFSIIMIDIDHFKNVNDKFDHLMGSFVISQVGKQIQTVIRDVDYGGRFGGDEFIVLLPETDSEGAYQVASRLRDLVNHTQYNNGTHQVKITISQGVACFTPDTDGQKPPLQDILRLADISLYEAKNSGRNCIVAQNCEKPLKLAS